MTAETDSLLREILRSVLGAEARLAKCRVIKSDHEYAVLSVEVQRPTIQIIAKLAGPEAPLPCPFDRTAALHRLMRARTNVPLPTVLAADVTCRVWPVRYMLRGYVPGTEWKVVRSRLDAQELSEAYRQIGQAVAEIHSVRFPAFGELSADGTIESGKSPVEALAERAKRRIPIPAHVELFNELVNNHMNLFTDVTEASLCHEDLHGHNLLFHKDGGRWRLSAILDFDSAWAGHHESDLARLELWRGMVGEGFWDTYRAVHQMDELYLQRRPIYQLLWCLEYASASPEHIADTRRVCAELGIQAVQNIGQS